MKIIKRLIDKYGYKATIDKRPFGSVTIRFLEPKNVFGRFISWVRTIFQGD